MNKWKRLLIRQLGWLWLVLVSCNPSPPSAPTSSSAIPVATPFVNFYSQNGGNAVFGEAISDLCVDGTGRNIQYFERFRLDQDPAGGSISVFPLGEWAFATSLAPTAVPGPASGQSRYFPEAGQQVEGDFLSFYDNINGPLLLGLPLSPQLTEGELRVQYFENGRLEWHPELSVALRVQIGPLAQAHYAYAASQLNCALLARPVPAALLTAANVETNLNVPILYPGNNLEVYVTVTTPAGAPVEAADVTIEVTFDGQVTTTPLGQTNGEGKLNGPIVLENFSPGKDGTVEVLVSNPAGTLLGSRSLPFKTRW